MKQSASPTAIATYAIPPHSPPEVEEAKTEFDGIAAKWADTKGELQDAAEALDAAGGTH